jgi:DNA primase catalytic subunit
MQVTRDYYVKQFPFEHLWTLIYGDLFREAREFAFQCGPELIYRRWKGFDTWQELAKYCRDEDVRVIHLGGVYNFPMRYKDTVTMPYVYFKELIFDVDIDLYDHKPAVRTCPCKGKPTICEECWKLLVTAIKVLRYQLVDRLGLKNVRFYFSGRRGIHCVVWDPKISKLFPEEKASIVKFVSRPFPAFGVIKDLSLYPCIDIGVSANDGHLIKAPFSLHKSGRIATEINPSNILSWPEMIEKATPINYRLYVPK